MQIKKLSFLSPRKVEASLEFQPGLNVIYGASDTGKSFIVDAIDFMLGSSRNLKDIPERVGYENVSLEFSVPPARLERSVDGGDFRLFEGAQSSRILKAKHDPQKDDNISKYLLSNFNLSNKEIKLNAQGKKRKVSFRDFSDLLIIRESLITKEGSPALSGQYTSKTPEKSLFKLLLTGVDDSALISAKKGKPSKINTELIDQLILEHRSSLRSDVPPLAEVQEQLAKLDETLNSQKKAIDSLQENLQNNLEVRNTLYQKKEKISARLEDIQELLEKFDLLNTHYSNDLERLEAIKESGVLINFLQNQNCPLCGALPESQKHDLSCDGDVKFVVEAAQSEVEKIQNFQVELENTIIEIQREQSDLLAQLKDCDDQFKNIQSVVANNLAPALAESQNKFSDVIQKRYEVNEVQATLQKITDLEKMREQYTPEQTRVTKGEDAGVLSKVVLGAFSKTVENLLGDWGFPNLGQVYFDEETFDIVVADKPRGSRGKGLRAITHAAFSIALLEYCIAKNLPHPGFVVLDSPLLAYKEPEAGNEGIEDTDLKDRFYRYLANIQDYQIIVCENTAPPEKLQGANVIHFTGNLALGRHGFFPVETL